MTLPKHIAIIMDGNGRWAEERGLKRSEGHLAGANAVRIALQECLRLGIPHLSLYAFSTENWKRPQEEVNFLFKLFCDFVQKELPLMLQEGVKLSVVGNREKLPFTTQKALNYALDKTKDGKKIELTLALNYSGSDEILRAGRFSALELLQQEDVLEKLQQKARSKEDFKAYLKDILSEEAYSLELFRQQLYLPYLPDPDLIIRTSGELRLSNFFLLQAAYSELYFTSTYWPDFDEKEFQLALDAYTKRKRRFGAL